MRRSEVSNLPYGFSRAGLALHFSTDHRPPPSAALFECRLQALKTWLDEQRHTALPKSPLGQAISYALSNWAALVRYPEQGYLAIDNNLAERTLRPAAIGRKNWRAPEVPRRYSGRSPPRDALLAMFA